MLNHKKKVFDQTFVLCTQYGIFSFRNPNWKNIIVYAYALELKRMKQIIASNKVQICLYQKNNELR